MELLLFQSVSARLPSAAAKHFAGVQQPLQPVGIRRVVPVGRRGSSRVRINNSWRNNQISAKLDSSGRVAEVELTTAEKGDEGSKKQQKKLKVLLVAGGTGGHVYPAIAIADEIRSTCGEEAGAVEVEFAGAKDRLEWSAVPNAGYGISPIPAVAIRRPFASVENLQLPPKLLWALFCSWKLLREVKPNVVVGTGGYVSGPLCLMAAVMGYPVAVLEQNAYAGLTNRLLGHVAEVVFVAFSAAIPYFPKNKSLLYGNPIRMELRQYVGAAVARRLFFPDNQARERMGQSENGHPQLRDLTGSSGKRREQVVLILGGSLGAQAINKAVAGMAATMLEENPTRHIIWQTGPAYFEEIVAQFGNHPRLAIFPYENHFSATLCDSTPNEC